MPLALSFLGLIVVVGPVFRTDDLMQVFRNAVIPSSNTLGRRSPPPPVVAPRGTVFLSHNLLSKLTGFSQVEDLRLITDLTKAQEVGVVVSGTRLHTHICLCLQYYEMACPLFSRAALNVISYPLYPILTF